MFRLVSFLSILSLIGCTTNAFVAPSPGKTRSRFQLGSSNSDTFDKESKQRRKFLWTSSSTILGLFSIRPQVASARYVLDDETGEYVEVQDEDWQTAWKQRIDKAQTMSTDEIFQAARGAGNVDLRDGPESDASKKRRAMSACRDTTVRAKAAAGNERECTARVFAGEVDFLLKEL